MENGKFFTEFIYYINGHYGFSMDKIFSIYKTFIYENFYLQKNNILQKSKCQPQIIFQITLQIPLQIQQIQQILLQRQPQILFQITLQIPLQILQIQQILSGILPLQ